MTLINLVRKKLQKEMLGDGKKSKSDVNLNYDFYIYCD